MASNQGGFSEFERGKRKDTDDKVTSEEGTSFPESRKHRFSPTSKVLSASHPNEKMQSKISQAHAIGAFEQLDHEAHPSPNRRFIFDLGSSRRSLSFKEGSESSQSTLFEPTRLSMPTFLINNDIDPRITLSNNTCLLSRIFMLMPIKARVQMQTVSKHFCTVIEETMPRLYGGRKYSSVAAIEAKVHTRRSQKMKEAKEWEENKEQALFLVSSVLHESEKYADAKERLGHRHGRREVSEIKIKLHSVGLWGFEHWTREQILAWLSSATLEY